MNTLSEKHNKICGRPNGPAYKRMVVVETEDGCHICTSHKPNVHGYLKKTVSGVGVIYHRYLWELKHGPIPKDFVIDHVCHNRRCLNTDHLRMVTIETNTRNQSIRQTNTSGMTGIKWKSTRKRWIARIGIGKEKRIEKQFETLLDAMAFRKSMELRLGYVTDTTRWEDL